MPVGPPSPEASPTLDRGQRHRRHQRTGQRSWVPAIVRSVGVRGEDDQPARALLHRRRGRQLGSELPDAGIFLDAITITANGATVLADGAETSPNGWTLDGFTSVATSVTHGLRQLLHRVEPDLHVLRPVPEDRPVQLRLGQHPAGLGRALPVPGRSADLLLGHLAAPTTTPASTTVEGLILPIDAHPARDRPAGRWRRGVAQPGAAVRRDVRHCRRRTRSRCTSTARPSYIRGQAAQPLFDDTRSYWNAKTPSSSVKVAGAGVTLRVIEEKGTTMKVRLGTSAGGLQARRHAVNR